MFPTLRYHKFDTLREVRVKGKVWRLGDAWKTSAGDIYRIEGFRTKWTNGMLITFSKCRYFQNRNKIIVVQSNLIEYKGDVFASEYVRDINIEELFSKYKVTLMMADKARERKDVVTVASVLIESDFGDLGKNN